MAGTAGTLLSIRDLSVRYTAAQQRALSNLTVDVASGTRVCVLGENGSGKTTFAYASCGIVPLLIPAKMGGTVDLMGRSPSQSSSIREFAQGTAILFQNPEFQFLGFSVLDELAVFLGGAAGRGTEVMERIGRFLDMYEMRHLLLRDARRMSMGEMQRIAILSATIGHPQLILFDEPTSALDQDGLNLVRQVLDNSPEAAAIVFTHDVDWGRSVALRVIGLREGAKVLDRPWQDVRSEDLDVVMRCNIASDLLSGSQEIVRVLERASNPGRRIKKLVMDGVTYIHPQSRVPALCDIDLEANAGEVVCLVGSNGSGKTTLLLAAAGLLKLKTGRVQFRSGATAMAPTSSGRQRVGVMLQNPSQQFLADSVSGELRLSLQRVPGGQSSTESILQTALDAFHFSDAGADPESLSFGWQKILTLACCLCMDPDIYVLDEPELGLDRGNRNAVRQVIDHVAHSCGRVVIMASHDEEFARSVSDRVITLDSGKVVG